MVFSIRIKCPHCEITSEYQLEPTSSYPIYELGGGGYQNAGKRIVDCKACRADFVFWFAVKVDYETCARKITPTLRELDEEEEREV